MAKITFSKKEIYIWEQIEILIEDLPQNTEVKLIGKAMVNSGYVFESEGRFISDAQGKVNVAQAHSVGGTYTGIEPMGMFWSMKAQEYIRESKKEHYTPQIVEFAAYVDEQLMAASTLTRLFMNPDVTITPVKDYGLYAEYYAPKGKKQKNNIIVFGGSDGKITYGRVLARYLSSQGFGALALAYFGEEGVPKDLVRIPVETIGNAIKWLTDYCGEEIKIGVSGISRGGEFSLLASSYYDEITAVAALTPSSVSWESEDISGCYPSWSYEGKDLPFIKCDYDQDIRDALNNCDQPVEVASTYLKFLKEAEQDTELFEACSIKVENINGDIMLVSGKDDLIWPAYEMCLQVEKRLKDKNFSHKCIHLAYEHVGHSVFRDGYTSTMSMLGITPGMQLLRGGSPKYNADAQADVRQRMVEFFKDSFDYSIRP